MEEYNWNFQLESNPNDDQRVHCAFCNIAFLTIKRLRRPIWERMARQWFIESFYIDIVCTSLFIKQRATTSQTIADDETNGRLIGKLH